MRKLNLATFGMTHRAFQELCCVHAKFGGYKNLYCFNKDYFYLWKHFLSLVPFAQDGWRMFFSYKQCFFKKWKKCKKDVNFRGFTTSVVGKKMQKEKPKEL